MDQKVVLGYWGIRGRGQVGRLLLTYTQANWEDFRYNSMEQWFANDKKNLGLDFPNLPYLIEGDSKFTESEAINRYIIKRSNKKELLGKSLKEQAIVDCLIGILNQLRVAIVVLFYDKNWQNLQGAALEKTKPKLEYIQKFIGDKDFLMGYLTLPDFLLSELSFFIQKIWPQEYQKHKFLQRVRTNIENVPQIKVFYQKENSLKNGPFCSPFMRSIDL